MSTIKTKYFNMSDGEDLDNFLNFLEKSGIEYDCTGTGDVDFDGVAENNVIIFYSNEKTIDLINNYLNSI